VTRTIGSSGAKTAATIREAGIRLIYQHGYEAMSLRELAAEVGVQAGSLYKYFKNKEGLLHDLMTAHMDDLLSHLRVALTDVTGARQRLLAFASFHLEYHRTRHMELHIVNAELRCLSPVPRLQIVGMRRQYEDILADILEQGVAEREFTLRDVRITTYAILAMLTGIGAWYRPGGRVGLDEIIEIHTGLILGGIESAEPVGARAPPSRETVA
jgi:AcrR family transcriptional regulator